ncbi:TonB-dependent receptor [Sphingobium indicum]|uniref:TonB-dependent receptor n=2 Tax=Sphingobium indicum TaxID=332055 RepID=A0A1L5BJY9_SPHIB|nr:TonB-dependent receptor [Sphingobium indicum]APL93132.1 TonB-dependent receptor [Sphingobium indicum B90A]KEY98608.1 TonB-dependent receptor [Sphingomonas sp. BHC-A]NYI22240.1 iron complex outermembrane receptor protein [Sphingobium indicum]RYM03040.1 TonB-dependent receptor [Sphingobium indicum]
MTRLSALRLSLVLASSWSACAMAQEAQSPQVDDGGAIIVTGTRAVGMQAAESAAPIQVLSQEAISHVGQPNLNQVLTQIVPSFTAQTQGTDLSSFSLSARLRGLSPNHTLVLVNGKRRHGNGILQVISGAFQGSAAPSIDLIPPDAIARVEVFQEGAAAVYGTDAIAGVINFILKDNNEGGSFKITGGQYYDSEGELFSASGNMGFKLGEDGFFNLSLFHRRQDYTTVGTGQVQITRPDGTLQPNTPAQWSNLAGDALSGINGGQPKTYLTEAFYNMGYDFGGIELYSFGDYARRIGYAKQGYRHPKRICYETGNLSGGITPAAYNPNICYSNTGTWGMVPLQHVIEDEYSFTVGAKGEASGWNYDLSTTYGYQKDDIWTEASAHREVWQESYAASLQGIGVPNTVDKAYDGGFRLSQTTVTADIRKEFEVGLAGPLTFAFGGEYRRDTYEIVAGDYYSTYKTGVQSFPGYKSTDAGKFRRSSRAGYINLIAEPIENWSIDLAGRYEDYTDFGDTTIGKITTRYDFSDAFALRGTVSTGFRAPTLAEQKYSTINVGPTSAVAQLPAGTPAAVLLGFQSLKPEKSTNFSSGVVLRPIPKLAITLDGYYIKIKDRIAGTAPRFAVQGGVTQPGGAAIFSALNAAGIVLDPALPNVGVASFTNGIDTRTWGIDFAAAYPIALDFGKLDLSLTANYNKTKITQNKIPTVFSAVSESNIERASPEYKIVAGFLFTSGRFTFNARETFYGKTSVLVTPQVSCSTLTAANQPCTYEGVVKATALTDVEASYDFTDFVTFSVGANNLFGKRPETPSLLQGVTIPAGTSPFINGAGSYNSYYGHSPYSTSGGYYYARLDFKF